MSARNNLPPVSDYLREAVHLAIAEGEAEGQTAASLFSEEHVVTFIGRVVEYSQLPCAEPVQRRRAQRLAWYAAGRYWQESPLSR